ncbi:MAG: KR domain-containing protein, partial [Methylocystaceae bacterium]|nr:KR domain-containing protein [Methylocystaceae bacterium]
YPLRGIFHLAGEANAGVLSTLDLEQTAEALRAKINGALALAAATQNNPPDFTVYFSSLSGQMGTTGLGHYSAANIYLDALAEKENALGRRSLSLVLGPVETFNNGMGERDMASAQMRALGLYPLPFASLTQTLTLGLSQGFESICVFQSNPEHLPSIPILRAVRKTPAQLLDVGSTLDEMITIVTSLVVEVLEYAFQNGLSPNKNLFDLGLDSLVSMRLIARVREATGRELTLQTLFEHPTVEGLAQQLCVSDASVRDKIIPGSGRKGEALVLSYGQQRMWALDRIEGGTASYNIPFALRLRGAFDAEAFELALRDIVLRHEPLRTVIVESERGPVGRLRDIGADERLVAFEDLTDLQGSIVEEAIRSRIDAQSDCLFDLSRDLMMRAQILRVGREDHVLILVLHHIAGDGVSVPVLVEELGIGYGARLQGLAPVFAPLAVSYSDYAAWQREWFEESGELKRQLAYWREVLSGAPDFLSLPTDYRRTADRSREAGYAPVQIDSKTTQALEALAQMHGTTLFAVLMGLYGSLLGRLARQEEVLIGFPVAGRDQVEIEGLIGFFVNTLVLRVDVSGSPRVYDLIERVKQRSVGALSHQDAPFDRLVEDLAVERSLSHTPLFQAMFAWLDQGELRFKLGETTLENLNAQLPTAKFDVTLLLGRKSDGSLEGIFEYDASLYSERTICSWVDQFARLLAGAVADEQRSIGAIPLISAQERELVVSSFNDTQQDIP